MVFPSSLHRIIWSYGYPCSGARAFSALSSAWISGAIGKIEADFQRSADTHLIPLDLPCFPNVHIYLKDESTHPTGSLKHRLARSLFLYSLCNGWLNAETTVIEASSGSTAVSEAYFARLLGLPFVAVVPSSTAASKLELIKFYGGQIHAVDRADQIYSASRQLRQEIGNAHFIDQFTYAERATDWRSNNNIATSIFSQMKREPYSVPTWIVMSAGTGGTSATIGRYIRYRCHPTQLLVVDPENSVFFDYYNTQNCYLTINRGSNIEGIGRPRVEPSFVPGVIDRMEKVPDVESLAIMQWISRKLGRKVGPSTGTNLYGVLKVAQEMHVAGEKGSIITLLCDSGERYLNTYYNPQWVQEHIGDTAQALEKLEQFT